MPMIIRPARYEERDKLCALAKTSKYTKDFSNSQMFSGETHFAKGWIRVAEIDGRIVGFTCVRHKVKRTAETVLYFVVVDPAQRGKGVGHALIQDMYDNSPYKTFTLNVMKTNFEAASWYYRMGWLVAGESLGGQALALRIER